MFRKVDSHSQDIFSQTTKSPMDPKMANSIVLNNIHQDNFNYNGKQTNMQTIKIQKQSKFGAKLLTAIATCGIFVGTNFLSFKSPDFNTLTSNPRNVNIELIFGEQAAYASPAQIQVAVDQFDIKFIKRNKDGSEVYKINGKTVKLSKKDLEIAKTQIERVNVSNSSSAGVGTQFIQLPAAGVGTAVVAYIARTIGVRSTVALYFLASACASNPGTCWNVAQGLTKGSGWAWNEARRMARI
jgi:hypothetical protein